MKDRPPRRTEFIKIPQKQCPKWLIISLQPIRGVDDNEYGYVVRYTIKWERLCRFESLKDVASHGFDLSRVKVSALCDKVDYGTRWEFPNFKKIKPRKRHES